MRAQESSCLFIYPAAADTFERVLLVYRRYHAVAGAAQVGGRLEVESAPGGGTTLYAMAPVRHADTEQA